MRTVLLSLILLFSSSLFAISLEDGLRIRLNSYIGNNYSYETYHKVSLEFIELYLDALKYKELKELSSNELSKSHNALIEAKIKATIDNRQTTLLKKKESQYFATKNRNMLDKINYKNALAKIETLLHVKIENVKLPLIPTPLKKENSSDEKWENYKTIQNNLNNSKDKRETIKNRFQYRVVTYNLLAENTNFLNSLLNKNSFYIQPTIKIEKKVPLQKKKPIVSKKIKKSKHCYKVNTDILNVRKKPYTQSKIVHRYTRDEIVCSIQQNFSWVKTQHGWCSKDYLLEL